MKKLYTVLVLSLFCGSVFSQQLKEFEVKEFNVDVPLNVCDNTKYGVLVFISAIRDLKFKINNDSDALINQKYSDELQAYILCVEPTEEERKYRLTIKQSEYVSKEVIGIVVGANQRLCWKIDSKQKTVEITVLGKDNKPLDNALLEIKGKPIEHTNSVGYSKIELPNSEKTTLFISHEYYKDKEAISVSPGEKRSVRLFQFIGPPKSQLYPPFYLAVTAGLSAFGSMSRGEIKNGGSALIGADLAYFFKNHGIGIKLNVATCDVNFSGSDPFAYRDQIMLVGPAYYGRYGKGSWAFTVNIGLGALNWKLLNLSEGGASDKNDSYTSVGFFTSIGVNYMFTQHVGISLNMQYIGGKLEDQYGWERKPGGIGGTFGINFRF